MKKNIILLMLIIISGTSFCQFNNKNFFPLNVGNKYIYFCSWFSFPGGGGSAMKVSYITGDTIAYGKRYYFMLNFPFINSWVRLDSLTGSLYKLDINNSCSYYNHEIIIDSLRAKLNAVTTNCIFQQYQITCTDTSYSNIFGTLRQRKSFSNYCASAPYTCIKARSYFDSIGISDYSYSFTGGGNSYQETWELRGCILNGILYGDTSTVLGIRPISSEVPKNFHLSQNYPNPFNPQTKIKFDIPAHTKWQTSNVKLIIYDLLGREVTTLVNEELKPGTYEADWDGSYYSSGVYLYKLISGDYTETKKMVLMK